MTPELSESAEAFSKNLLCTDDHSLWIRDSTDLFLLSHSKLRNLNQKERNGRSSCVQGGFVEEGVPFPQNRLDVLCVVSILIESPQKATSGRTLTQYFPVNLQVQTRSFRPRDLMCLYIALTRHCSKDHVRVEPCSARLDSHALSLSHYLPACDINIDDQSDCTRKQSVVPIDFFHVSSSVVYPRATTSEFCVFCFQRKQCSKMLIVHDLLKKLRKKTPCSP